MSDAPVVVFGASGFVGRYVVKRLAESGSRIRAACRDPESASYLKPMGDVGQIALVQANLRDEASVRAAVDGAAAVINLAGILYERGRQSFAAVHVAGAERIARAARAAGCARLVQISAIGASAGAPSLYGRSKAAGEAAVRGAFPEAVLLRPSIVFGPEDGFFNLFGALATISPVLPLIDGGETRIQPVYVGDVAGAVVGALDRAAPGAAIYELGGPRVYSFRELMEIVIHQTGRHRLLVPVPGAIARFEAWFLEWLPKPPLTRDQVRMLAVDNMVGDDVGTLASLAIAPTPLEIILPTYLGRYRRGGAKPEAALAFDL